MKQKSPQNAPVKIGLSNSQLDRRERLLSAAAEKSDIEKIGENLRRLRESEYPVRRGRR